MFSNCSARSLRRHIAQAQPDTEIFQGIVVAVILLLRTCCIDRNMHPPKAEEISISCFLVFFCVTGSMRPCLLMTPSSRRCYSSPRDGHGGADLLHDLIASCEDKDSLLPNFCRQGEGIRIAPNILSHRKTSSLDLVYAFCSVPCQPQE